MGKGSNIEQTLQLATCRVFVGDKTGTAWICSEEGHMLTAGHIFTDEENNEAIQRSFEKIIEVQFVDQKKISAKLVFGQCIRNKGIDFAVLQINNTKNLPESPPIRLVESVNGDGFLVGYGETLDDSSFASGKFTLGGVTVSNSRANLLFRFDSSQAHDNGYSGSAVYCADFQGVVGIQIEKTTETKKMQDLLVMPMFRIVSILRREIPSLAEQLAGPPLVPDKDENRFKYNAGTVKFFGREKELRSLYKFLEVEDPFCWIAITGKGGSGKTRLCYQLVKIMEIYGWNAPWLSGNYDEKELEKEKENIRRNTLFVLDYVKWKTNEIGRWMASLLTFARNSSNKIRVILIERETKDIVTSDWDTELQSFVFGKDKNTPPELWKNTEEYFMKLSPLSVETMKQIIANYAEKANKIVDPDVIIKKLTDIVDPMFCRPLYALFLTDAAMSGENLLNWDRKDALRYVCYREWTRVKNCIETLGFDKFSDKKQTERICEAFIIIATLSGGLRLEQAKKIASAEWNWLENIAQQKGHYGNIGKLLAQVGVIPTEADNDTGRVPPLEPDLIGEYYCILWAQTLMLNGEKERLKRVLALALENDMRATALAQNRIMQDFEKDVQDNDLRDLFGVIKIPDGVTSIGANTFSGCRSLVKVHVPKGVTSIEAGAFYLCASLIDVPIPEGVKSIGVGAFQRCTSLVKVRIPEGVMSIGAEAFAECENLVEAYIPDSITSVGYRAFSGCNQSMSISLPLKDIITGWGAFPRHATGLRPIKHKDHLNNCYMSKNKQDKKQCDKLVFDEPDLAHIFSLLSDSIRDFYINDGKLLRREYQNLCGIDRSCTFRIGHYLCNRIKDTKFQSYNVDMEYNKNGINVECINGKGVQPDLIVHQRGNNEANLLIVEFEYGSNDPDVSSNVEKLRMFTDQNGKYRYKLGILIKLRSEIAYCNGFQNGMECWHYNITVLTLNH
ncbi:MAG: leucine-rich repeat protein [Nitrososphaerota archaeon]|jgi:hypothetical protein|nr:leucine-rich repeat protein [Nitrososphaerota archaeon]